MLRKGGAKASLFCFRMRIIKIKKFFKPVVIIYSLSTDERGYTVERVSGRKSGYMLR